MLKRIFFIYYFIRLKRILKNVKIISLIHNPQHSLHQWIVLTKTKNSWIQCIHLVKIS